ncbi:arsenate reductase [Gammaproteobacteria bacterium]|nr:arsenate reductase ArsC [Zoogloeaceae bacterium]MCK6385826.1 arsenate reductase ArsC [Rhodocyclaceae bacterium]CAG0940165.1 arsenate reductase [Gammaproteobacteria bacterium]
MPGRPWNILILCTGNSARSILAEALFNALGGGRVRACSAGSRPAGKVNPFALELLEAQGLESANLRSKSWDEFAAPGAPPLDLVVTVCGNAANETCPAWPGDFLRAHWGIDDPAAADGDDGDKRAAFMKAYALLAERILTFLSLSFETMPREELQQHLDEIGRAGAAAAVPAGLTFSDD